MNGMLDMTDNIAKEEKNIAIYTQLKTNYEKIRDDEIQAAKEAADEAERIRKEKEEQDRRDADKANPDEPKNNDDDPEVENENDGEGESSGVGGIVAGVIGGVVVLGAAGYCMWKRGKNNEEGGKRDKFIKDSLV